MMTDKERLEADEYEKQYYGFSSTEFFVDFCFQYKKVLQTTIRAAVADFMNNREDEKTLEYDANMGRQQALNLYDGFMEVAKNPLEKLKEESRKIFAIPRNVVLEEDQYRVKNYTEEDLLQLKLDVAKLEDDLIKVIAVNSNDDSSFVELGVYQYHSRACDNYTVKS
nr:unnamed protein product [Callosobruchus analis]